MVCSYPPYLLLLPLLLYLSWKIETRSLNLVIALDSSHKHSPNQISIKSCEFFSLCFEFFFHLPPNQSSLRSFSSPSQTFVWVSIACYVYERWISNLGDNHFSLVEVYDL